MVELMEGEGMCIYHSAHPPSVLRAVDGVLPAGPNGAESGRS